MLLSVAKSAVDKHICDIKFLIFFSFILPILAHAVVEGHSLGFSVSADEIIMRQRTVRLVHRAHGNYVFDCSAVIFDESTIISAAHCRDPSTEKFWQRGEVFVEVIGMNENIVRYQVAKMKAEDSERMDLMILTVNGRLPITASLPLALSGCGAADDYFIAGYGINSLGEFGHELNVGLYHQFMVSGSLGFELIPDQGKICGGDSGAGVFCRHEGHLALVGVVDAFDRTESISSLPYTPQLCRDGLNLVGTNLRAIDILRAEMP